MKRPIAFILLFLICGILTGQHLYKVLGVVLFMLIILGMAVFISRTYSLEAIKLLVIAALIGYVLGINSLSYSNREIDKFADSEIKPYMNCTVESIDKKYNGYSRYIVKLNSLKVGDKVYDDCIKLYLYSSAEVVPGDIIEIKTGIEHGREMTSMREYKEKLYMLSRHVEYRMSGYPYKVGYENSFNTYMYRLRTKISEVYDNALPSDEADLLKAIILGDRLELDEDMYELFRNAGIVHIIAVSGLHISIFAAILMIVLGRFNEKLADISLLVILFLYALFTGCSPSVVRAVIMMYVFIIGNLLGEDYDVISSCAFAAIILLIYSPCYLYDIGFQYSFTAVFIIGMTADLLRKYKISNRILCTFIVSIAVTFGVKPITLYYFGYINFIDFAVNIIVICLMSTLVLFGGICGIAGLISAKAAIFSAGLPYVILNGIEDLSRLSLGSALSHIEAHIYGLAVMTVYLTLFLAYMYIIKKKKSVAAN